MKKFLQGIFICVWIGHKRPTGESKVCPRCGIEYREPIDDNHPWGP